MPEIYGNTTGLSPSEWKALERIYRRRIPLEELATPELIRSLADASRTTGRQVGTLVHRSGQVDYVIVGDAGRLILPDIGRLRAAQGRFRGLRLIHTHLHGEPLTRDDLVDLVRLRLDAVVVLQLSPDNNVRAVSYAYNVPDVTIDAGDSNVASPEEQGGKLPYHIVGPLNPSQLDVDFGRLILGLEAEFAKVARSRRVTAKDGRAILVCVSEKAKRQLDVDPDERIDELRDLARTAGVEVVDTAVQIRERIDPKFVLGKGKLDDVVLRALSLDAQMLIFDKDLSPAQVSAIAKLTDLKIIDRTQLILDIFAQRAESRDGKLQVELAQLKYSLPRLGQKDDSLSRLTGGIGGRGPGETKLEVGRRRAKERVHHLESQLKTLAKQREQRRRRRGRLGVPVVAIVGYTNAGKSTLLNALTDSDVLAEDRLFATLDPRSRRLRFPEEREVVITDTVGFIRDLPRDLFAAFRATFEETADADLIVQVVDAADSAKFMHIETTEALLSDLSLSDIPRTLVFNKIDLATPGESESLRRQHPDAVLISATRPESTRALLAKIASMLAERWQHARPTPYTGSWDRTASDADDGDAGAASDADASDADASDADAASRGGYHDDGSIDSMTTASERSLTTLEEMLGGRRRGRVVPNP